MFTGLRYKEIVGVNRGKAGVNFKGGKTPKSIICHCLNPKTKSTNAISQFNFTTHVQNNHLNSCREGKGRIGAEAGVRVNRTNLALVLRMRHILDTIVFKRLIRQ